MNRLFLVSVFLFFTGCEEASEKHYYWRSWEHVGPAGREVAAVKIDAKTNAELDRRSFAELHGWEPRSVRNTDFNGDGGNDFFIRNTQTGEQIYLYSNTKPKPRSRNRG